MPTPPKQKTDLKGRFFVLEVQAGFEPADNGVADRGLTTWLLHQILHCLNIIAEDFVFVKSFLVYFFFFADFFSFYLFPIVKFIFLC